MTAVSSVSQIKTSTNSRASGILAEPKELDCTQYNDKTCTRHLGCVWQTTTQKIDGGYDEGDFFCQTYFGNNSRFFRTSKQEYKACPQSCLYLNGTSDVGLTASCGEAESSFCKKVEYYTASNMKQTKITYKGQVLVGGNCFGKSSSEDTQTVSKCVNKTTDQVDQEKKAEMYKGGYFDGKVGTCVDNSTYPITDNFKYCTFPFLCLRDDFSSLEGICSASAPKFTTSDSENGDNIIINVSSSLKNISKMSIYGCALNKAGSGVVIEKSDEVIDILNMFSSSNKGMEWRINCLKSKSQKKIKVEYSTPSAPYWAADRKRVIGKSYLTDDFDTFSKSFDL